MVYEGLIWLARREWGNQPLHWYIGDSFPHSLLMASWLLRSKLLVNNPLSNP